MPEDRVLELSGQTLRDLIGAATDRLLAHVASLPDQPAADTEGGPALARSLREPLPEDGRPFDELLDLLFDRVIPKSFNTAGPGYLAYIPGGGLPHSAVADLISGITNRYVGVFAAAPGLAALEANVVRWFCEMVGYPPGSGGVLTSGGSLSNFSAFVTARRERLPEDFLSGVVYASDQTHHSVPEGGDARRPAGAPRPRDSDRRGVPDPAGRARRRDPARPRGRALAVSRRRQRRHDEHGRRGRPRRPSRTSRAPRGSGFTSTPRTAASSR